jgi:phage major head subunit gpT-like protein
MEKAEGGPEMIIKNETLEALRTMVRGEFAARMAELSVDPQYQSLATVITSNTAGNTYGWLGKFPHLREWIGNRVINSIKESAYAIANKLYEATLGVARTDIEDDNLGIYRPLARAQADEVIAFFNRQIAALLSRGFTSLGYDGQPFFDAEHPVYPRADGTGAPMEASNIQGGGSGRPWYLLALGGVLKPFILQQRLAPEMDEITDPKNDSVFMKDQYLYGIRWRGNFGYGFWQQAVVSKEDLTAASFQAAKLRMLTFRRDGGDPLGIMPTHLVVDPANEAAARDLLERQEVSGSSNPNYHAVALIVLPWLLGSGNANLGALALSAGTLSPSFDPGVTEYTASVANGVTGITATGTAEDGSASLGGNNGQEVTLSAGANTVTITVTASDGTSKTYTVTVTRAAA